LNSQFYKINLNILSKFFNFIIYFFVAYIISTKFTVNHTSVFLFICSVYSVLFLFDFGSVNAASQSIYNSNSKILSENIIYTLIFSVIVSFFFFIIAIPIYFVISRYFIINDLPEHYVWIFNYSLMIYLALFSLFIISGNLERIFIIIGKSDLYHSFTIFISISTLLLILFNYENLNFIFLLISVFFSSYVSPLFTIFFLRKNISYPIIKKSLQNLKSVKNYFYKYWRYCLLFTYLNLIYVIYFGADLFFISSFFGVNDVSVFSFCQRINQIILMPGYIYCIFIWRRLIVLHEEKKYNEINKIVRVNLNYFLLTFVFLVPIMASFIYYFAYIFYDFVKGYSLATLFLLTSKSIIEIIFWFTSFLLVSLKFYVSKKILFLISMIMLILKYYLSSFNLTIYLLVSLLSVILILLFFQILFFKKLSKFL
jgi:hypothetical protein